MRAHRLRHLRWRGWPPHRLPSWLLFQAGWSYKRGCPGKVGPWLGSRGRGGFCRASLLGRGAPPGPRVPPEHRVDVSQTRCSLGFWPSLLQRGLCWSVCQLPRDGKAASAPPAPRCYVQGGAGAVGRSQHEQQPWEVPDSPRLCCGYIQGLVPLPPADPAVASRHGAVILLRMRAVRTASSLVSGWSQKP